jgi:hypothetical protein
MPTDAANLQHSWPDGIDWVVTLAYIGLIIGVLAAGYACMVLDLRAYLRSLRRALVLVTQYRFDLPAWAQKDRPRCIEALGLTLPCTADEVLAAYRLKVKMVHPDLGGDAREFMRLQQHFEQAMALVTKE